MTGEQITVSLLVWMMLPVAGACSGPAAGRVALTPADVSMAKAVIEENTFSLPGFTTGSRVRTGPGPFSPADALVLYALKYHHQGKGCVPAEWLAQALVQTKDTETAKRSATAFWSEYCAAQGEKSKAEADGLKQDFEWYINTKLSKRLKRSNAALEAQVKSEEAWRRAMESDRKSRDTQRSQEDQARLLRDSYKTEWAAQAAVASGQD